MLQAKNISKQTGKVKILQECSLQTEAGRFTAVVGPNGAGKTTLLNILSGETRKYQGELRLNGKPLSAYKNRDLSKIRAVLPQHTMVNFPFSVEQIVEIGRYAHQTTHAENQKIIGEVLELTHLTAFRSRPYQTLSGGEKQRVQMARAICQIWDPSPAPKYLLLDEPTSSLDLARQHGLLALAKRLCRRNTGVLAILHDLNLALQYADDILFLKNGKTVAYGPCQTVATKEVIEATFSHPVRLIRENGQLLIMAEAIVAKHSEKADSRKAFRKDGRKEIIAGI